jgi:hypothetical protein
MEPLFVRMRRIDRFYETSVRAHEAGFRVCAGEMAAGMIPAVGGRIGNVSGGFGSCGVTPRQLESLQKGVGLSGTHRRSYQRLEIGDGCFVARA